MTLLSVEGVTKRYVGRSMVTAVDDASFDLASGELATVFGVRRSGRTTLLRIAAGLVTPDSGRVTLDGVDLAEVGPVGTRVGWCSPRLTASHGPTVGDQMLAAALAVHRSRRSAQRAARAALERVGLLDSIDIAHGDLYPHELTLMGVARGLVHRPAVLVLDDPTLEVEAKYRVEVEQLIRDLARDGYAVLVALSTTMLGADRTMRIEGGRLRGLTNPASTPPTPLPVGGA